MVDFLPGCAFLHMLRFTYNLLINIKVVKLNMIKYKNIPNIRYEFLNNLT